MVGHAMLAGPPLLELQVLLPRLVWRGECRTLTELFLEYFALQSRMGKRGIRSIILSSTNFRVKKKGGKSKRGPQHAGDVGIQGLA